MAREKSPILEVIQNPAHADDSLLPLDADKKAAALNFINKIYGSFWTLNDFIQKDKLINSLRFNSLSVAQTYLLQLNDLLGGNGDLNEENHLRKLLRERNEDVEELREQLGQKVDTDGLGLRLCGLEKTVKDWWQSQGFGYSRGEFDSGYGAEIKYRMKFNCDVEQKHQNLFEENPISSQERQDEIVANLKTQLDLFEDNNRELCLCDTPRNKDYLVALLTNRFPGIHIWEIKLKNRFRGVGFVIHCVEATIPLAVIEEKKEKPKKKKKK